jgi:uncharacterized protein YukE
MTAIFTVDPEALQRLAQRIREAQAAIGTADRGPLRSAVTALSGGPNGEGLSTGEAGELTHAISAFLQAWGPALADLVDDAHRLADMIDLAARAYQDAETATEQSFLR